MQIIEDKSGKVIGAIDKIESNNKTHYSALILSDKRDFEKQPFSTNKNARDFILKFHKKQSSIKKQQSVMKTNKPTVKQLAARKKFAEMAKNGTLAKKRAQAKKKELGLKGSTRAEESLRKLKESLKNAKTPEQKRNIQDLIHRSEIGLKKPATKGLRTLCAESFNVVGLRKKDGTQKKGYVAKKGGKMVKVATKKKTTIKKQ